MVLPALISTLHRPCALLFALTLLASYIIISYIRSYLRLRHFPGPLVAQWSYLWLVSFTPSTQRDQIWSAVMAKYSSASEELVRIGPNELLTSSPDIIRRMNSARSTYGRGDWYRAVKLDPTGDSMLSMLDTAEHDSYKARVAPGYSGRDTPNMEAAVDGMLVAMARVIREKYLSSREGHSGELVYKPLDFAAMVEHFTIDVITQVAYSASFGYLEKDSDVHGYVQVIRDMVKLAVLAAEVPYFQAITLNKHLLRWFGPKPTDKSGVGKMMGMAHSIVAKRFSSDTPQDPKTPGGSADMLDSFVRHGLSQTQCDREVLLQINAGSDTTATVIRGTMLMLCSTPHAYSKLQHEIDSSGVSSPISLEAARKMPYLQAVIYEGIRHNPPVSALFVKKVPPGGDTLDGKFVPGGTGIGVAVRAVQMRKDVFGDDAELFRPERWTEATPERRAKMAASVELVFGHGRWMCAGRHLAFLELNKVYFELLRQFDFQLVNPKDPWRSENMNMYFQSNLWMKVTERGQAGRRWLDGELGGRWH